MPKHERNEGATGRARELLDWVRSYNKASGGTQFSLGSRAGVHERSVQKHLKDGDCALTAFIALVHALGHELYVIREADIVQDHTQQPKEN